MLRCLPPTLKRASCTDSAYNDSRQLEWLGLLQQCALESDHLWNVIPTIIFTVTAMAVFSELYQYLTNRCTCIAIQWKCFWLFSKFAEESTCVNFEFVLTFASFPEYPGHSSNRLKNFNFMKILQQKDDFANRFGKMGGWCLNAERELSLFMFNWYKCLLRLAGRCK